IGVTLDRITFDVTFTEATGDSDLGFMKIPAGTVGGVYGYHRGWVGDRNVVSVGFNWVMGDHVTPPKPLEHGHVIQVFGLPNMRTVLHCLPPKNWTEPGFMGLGMIYTAMPVTNAVPAVVAAPPGIVTLKDLPPIPAVPRCSRIRRKYGCRIQTPSGTGNNRTLGARSELLGEFCFTRAVEVVQCGAAAGHRHQQRLARSAHLGTAAVAPIQVVGDKAYTACPPGTV